LFYQAASLWLLMIEIAHGESFVNSCVPDGLILLA
jgi:hypothetical protein